jgi:hypothetical protein
MRKMTKIEVLTLTDDKVDKVVKIAGTDWDRKRKVTSAVAKRMGSMTSRKSLSDIAEKFGVSEYTVKYNTDPSFRMNEIWRCTEKTRRNGPKGKITCTPKNRVAYKRSLVAAGKVTAFA